MINGAIRRALQVAKMRAGQAPATHVPTPPQAPPPKREDMPVDPTRSKSAQERQKFQDGGIAAPYGVIDLGDKVILGAPHGEPIELSNGLKQRVKQIAAKHGAWYEGDPKDVGPNQELLGGQDAYRGSWDDAVARNVKGYPLEYLAPLFSNVDVNRQHETFANPQQTIFDSLLSNQAKARYFKDRDYDRDTLANFLKQGSEKDADFMRMAASPATKENLQKFFSTGEKLMWPENWQEYPNKLGKIAKRFEDSRNKFLKDAGPGVYVTGAGHIPELRNTFKDLKVIGGERTGYADGGTPTPPRRPVEFAGEDASRAFPGIWKNVDPVVKYNMGRQRGYAETYPPKETGDPNNPKSTRPKEFPIDRTGIELYRPEMSGSDLALELLHADPNAIKTRNTLLSTMSPQQLEELRNRLDYEDPEGNLTPQRRYDNAMDASMRSYLANKRDLPHSQGPASDIEYMQYTDEQKQHLDKLYDYMMSGKYADGGTVERPTKMNKKVKHALDVALSETHPKRFHHTLARTGYADGGLPDMNISPPDLANEVPYTHEKALASQFDVAKSAPYKPKSIKLGITKIAPPKKVGLRAPRSDIGKMRLRKNISVKPKKFKLASGGHPEIDDALRLASRIRPDR